MLGSACRGQVRDVGHDECVTAAPAAGRLGDALAATPTAAVGIGVRLASSERRRAAACSVVEAEPRRVVADGAPGSMSEPRSGRAGTGRRAAPSPRGTSVVAVGEGSHSSLWPDTPWPEQAMFSGGSGGSRAAAVVARYFHAARARANAAIWVQRGSSSRPNRFSRSTASHGLARRQPLVVPPQRHEQVERRDEEMPAAAAGVEHGELAQRLGPALERPRRRVPSSRQRRYSIAPGTCPRARPPRPVARDPVPRHHHAPRCCASRNCTM